MFLQSWEMFNIFLRPEGDDDVHTTALDVQNFVMTPENDYDFSMAPGDVQNFAPVVAGDDDISMTIEKLLWYYHDKIVMYVYK